MQLPRLIVIVMLIVHIPATTEASKIVFVGDSLTKPGPLGIVSGPIFVDILRAVLPTVEIVNRGAGGTTLVQWDDNLWDLFAAPEMPTTDLAIIMLGTNDAAGVFLPVADYGSRMEGLAIRALSEGAGGVMLMTPPSSSTGSLQTPESILLEGYRDEIIRITSQVAGVELGPDLWSLLEHPNHFKPDGVHLSNLGHELVASALIESMVVVPEPGLPVLIGLGLLKLALAHRSQFDSTTRSRR